MRYLADTTFLIDLALKLEAYTDEAALSTTSVMEYPPRNPLPTPQ